MIDSQPNAVECRILLPCILHRDSKPKLQCSKLQVAYACLYSVLSLIVHCDAVGDITFTIVFHAPLNIISFSRAGGFV